MEFYYNQMEYVMPGDSSVALSEILAALGMSGEVTETAVSDDSLFSVSNESGKWFLTVFSDDPCQFFFTVIIHNIRCGDSCVSVHSHIERCIVPVGKTSLGVVKLIR